MSRADDERIADILDAARQVAEVVERGKQAWDADRISQLAVDRVDPAQVWMIASVDVPRLVEQLS